MYELGVIGLGHIGVPIVNGALSGKAVSPDQVILYGHHPERLEPLLLAGASAAKSEIEVVSSCHYLLLSVKPQSLSELLPKIKPFLRPDHVIISIAAGISARYLKNALGEDTKIVLAMPNTPLQLGFGTTALSRIEPATQDEFAFAMRIFGVSGTAEEIPAELMNEVIALNGSSPAFFYRITQIFADRASQYGFDHETAMRLICGSMIGAAHMMLSSGTSLDDLIQAVCSKGGTTIAGLTAMNDAHLDQALIAGMEACTQRAYELGK